MRVKPLFAWYDIWIGAFWDRAKRKLYVLPLPCIGLIFELGDCQQCSGVGITFRRGFWFGFIQSGWLPGTCPECHGRGFVQLPSAALPPDAGSQKP
jgi:hypothetical protein